MMHLIRLFLPEMIKRGNGKICNIASNTGFNLKNLKGASHGLSTKIMSVWSRLSLPALVRSVAARVSASK